VLVGRVKAFDLRATLLEPYELAHRLEVACLDRRPNRFERPVDATEAESLLLLDGVDRRVAAPLERGVDVVVDRPRGALQMPGDVPNRPAREPQMARLLLA
jgi:hypothetical protein